MKELSEADRAPWTIRSASVAFKLHPKRLRKLLHREGFVSDFQLVLPDSEIVLRSPGVGEFLQGLAECMSLIQAGIYLNAPRPHERLLFEAGFIRPFIVADGEAIKDHGFRKSDLDAFLTAISADVSATGPELVSIPKAAKRANCSAAEIIRLLIDRKLTRVGRDPADHGYLSILVEPSEIEPIVRLPDHGCMSLREVEKAASWSTAVVKALVEKGHLASREVINPVKRNRQIAVHPDDLQSFQETFVSLQTLAAEEGIHFLKLRDKLAGKGVRPAEGFDGVPATFYLRSEVGAGERDT